MEDLPAHYQNLSERRNRQLRQHCIGSYTQTQPQALWVRATSPASGPLLPSRRLQVQVVHTLASICQCDIITVHVRLPRFVHQPLYAVGYLSTMVDEGGYLLL